VSRLVITKAAKSDNGMYSCSLSRHSSVLVHVHILNGEMFKYLVMYISKDRSNMSYCPLHEDASDIFHITSVSGDKFYFF
jgi:hypothetical protein